MRAPSDQQNADLPQTANQVSLGAFRGPPPSHVATSTRVSTWRICPATQTGLGSFRGCRVGQITNGALINWPHKGWLEV